VPNSGECLKLHMGVLICRCIIRCKFVEGGNGIGDDGGFHPLSDTPSFNVQVSTNRNVVAISALSCSLFSGL